MSEVVSGILGKFSYPVPWVFAAAITTGAGWLLASPAAGRLSLGPHFAGLNAVTAGLVFAGAVTAVGFAMATAARLLYQILEGYSLWPWWLRTCGGPQPAAPEARLALPATEARDVAPLASRSGPAQVGCLPPAPSAPTPSARPGAEGTDRETGGGEPEMGLSQDSGRDAQARIQVSHMQVARILRSQSIPPAPRRGRTTWREFVRQHARSNSDAPSATRPGTPLALSGSNRSPTSVACGRIHDDGEGQETEFGHSGV